ncbi:acyltransferase [Butyrivibrio sp. WCD3002]|uniref:acyltransferase n=1 Tax=Butyrivibrio sp. WCD3002 TaxID=1280676 RepID=UPI0026F3D54C|nr:acyltransferase [Butyrivibrio sp. WCD3002]
MLKHYIERAKIHKNPILYWRNKGVMIGERCSIHPTANLGSEAYLISIGNDVRINENVILYTHDGGAWVLRHMYKDYNDVDMFGKIKIGNNVHIGTRAIIMPGVEIGDNCIIGVGAIVTKSVPSNTIAAGIPARVIETIDEYVEKNKQRFLHTSKMSSEEKRKCLENFDWSYKHTALDLR